MRKSLFAICLLAINFIAVSAIARPSVCSVSIYYKSGGWQCVDAADGVTRTPIIVSKACDGIGETYEVPCEPMDVAKSSVFSDLYVQGYELQSNNPNSGEYIFVKK